MLEAIKRELEKYEGVWFLPDDLPALIEIVATGLANAGVGTEWLRVPSRVEYNLGPGPGREETDGQADEIFGG